MKEVLIDFGIAVLMAIVAVVFTTSVLVLLKSLGML